MKASMVRIWEVCKGIEADETLLARLYKRNIPVTLGPSGLPDAGGRKFSGVYVREDFKRAAVRYILKVAGRRAECETVDVTEEEENG